MISLTNKTSIITGASSGMGLAATQLFLKLGATVYGVDISPLPSTLPAHDRFHFHQLDLRDKDSPAAVVHACQRTFGPRIDVLLNVAGVMDGFHSVDSMDPAVWERVLAVNLTVPARLAGEVVRVFRQRQQPGGNIVNVSSRAGQSGAVAGAAYTASKHGLIGLTRNIAWRFHKEGIRCNAICPGGFNTGIMQSVDMSRLDQAALETVLPVQALHSTGDLKTMPHPGEVANLMAFLASDAAKEINGAIVPIDRAGGTV
ncbi:hypothetical protein HFD88_000241 [Aspergillus terreus]|nr:hypothetical protein HFD88_000241 [Aspergillus terreus]